MKAYVLAILAVLCWSFNVIIAQILENALTPWQIAFIRWFISAIIIFPLTFNLLKKNKKIILKYINYLIYTSFIGITISNTCVYYAAQTVHPVTLSLIGATGPIFLILFAWILANKKISLIQFIGLITTLVGVIVIVAHGRISNLGNMNLKIGDFWMLGTAISFGLYSYYISRRPEDLPLSVLLTMSICLGALFCLPMFLYDSFYHPLILGKNLTYQILWIMLYMGIFNSLIAYICWNRAITIAGTFKIGMIYYLMPVFSTIEAWAILNEKISPIQIIGGLIILGGILLSNKQQKLNRDKLNLTIG